MKTIAVAPLGCYFSNENTAMGLRPHQHYATVRLTFRTLGPLGFPVFEDTVTAIHQVVRFLTVRPFRSSTNERVADSLFSSIDNLARGRPAPEEFDEEGAAAWQTALDALEVWGGEYELAQLDLAVMGAPDDIGHSDGFATYSVIGE